MKKIIPRSLRRSYRKWQLKRAKKRQEGVPLREFVYLDEVSVYSLFASRVGALATEYSEAKSRTLQMDASLTSGINEKTHKNEAKIGSMFNQGYNTQILRKSTIQSTYKEFYDLERDTLILRNNYEDTNGKYKSIDKLIKDDSQHNTNFKSTKNLNRGDLVEFEVELSPEYIFKVNTVLNILVEFKDNVLELIPKEVMDINDILNQLLSGLVPIKCKVLNYKLLVNGGNQYLIHESLVENLLDIDIEDTSEFNIVGVIDKNLVWKDLRQILYDNNRYSLLCRIEKPIISKSWTSLKNMAAFRDIIPEVSQIIDSNDENIFNQSFMQSKKSDTKNNESEYFQRVLFNYGILLLENKDVELNIHIIRVLQDLAIRNQENYEGYDKRKFAFEEILAFIKQSYPEIDHSSEELIQLREKAKKQLIISHIQNKDTLESEDELFLESEIIAIYW